MKCIRCGYCCFMFDVIIVDPKYIDNFDPEGDVSEMDKLIHKPCNVICPHLIITMSSEYAECAVHNKPWYNMTPCYQHSVIGVENEDCRVGRHNMDNNWKAKYLRRSLNEK